MIFELLRGADRFLANPSRGACPGELKPGEEESFRYSFDDIGISRPIVVQRHCRIDRLLTKSDEAILEYEILRNDTPLVGEDIQPGDHVSVNLIGVRVPRSGPVNLEIILRVI
jgi:hypothetical protein